MVPFCISIHIRLISLHPLRPLVPEPAGDFPKSPVQHPAGGSQTPRERLGGGPQHEAGLHLCRSLLPGLCRQQQGPEVPAPNPVGQGLRVRQHVPPVILPPIPPQGVERRPAHQAGIAVAAGTGGPCLPAGDHRPGAGDARAEELCQEVLVAAAAHHFALGEVIVGVDQGIDQASFLPEARELLQKAGVGGAGAATAQAVGRQGRIETDPAVFRDDEGGDGAKACSRGQPQGQVEQGSAPHGQLRGLGKLHPKPQVVHPAGAVMAGQGRGQGLLDVRQLPDTILG